jgi:hypothetical protein
LVNKNVQLNKEISFLFKKIDIIIDVLRERGGREREGERGREG